MRQLRDLLVSAALAAGVGTVGMIPATPSGAQVEQRQVWIQIEAKNSRGQIAERLQAWAETLPNVQGFIMASGWYAAAIGPYDRAEAEAALSELKLLRAIPSDSFIAEPRLYRSQIDSPAPLAGGAQPGAEAPDLPPISGAAGAPTDPVAVTPIAPGLPGTAVLPGAVTPPTQPAETLAQSRAAEGALSREARMEIQRALIWAGVLDGGVDGAFGRGTRAAISAWQGAAGQEVTGVLSTGQQADLLAGWQAEVKALGLEAVRDDEAGIALDLPLGLVDFAEYTPPFAKYTARADSGLQIWLISQPGDARALADLYDQLQALPLMPAEGARSRGARGFEISGRDAQLQTEAWAELEGGAIKGYLVSARPADAERTARVLKAMRGSFRSLPGQVLDPGLIPLADADKADMLVGVEKRQPLRAGSGFYATPDGLVMTAASLVEGCGRVTLDSGAEAALLAAEAGAGVALLKPAVPLAPAAVAQFSADLPAPGSEVAVAGYSFGTDLLLPSVTFGQFEAPTALDGQANRARLALSTLAGDIGGAVLGGDGKVIGVLAAVPADPARVLPASVAYLAPAAAAITALASKAPTLRLEPPARGQMAPEDLGEIGTAMAVQVLCWQ